MRFKTRSLRVLDFDLEQRPLTYWTPDRPTGDITGIASCWVDDPKSMRVWLLGEMDQPEMLARFVERYKQADMVTGHYIRPFDLRQLQAALTENGMPALGPKLTQDTKIDLIGWGDLPKTQEFIAAMLGVKAPKVQMDQRKWRQANRLTEQGLNLTHERVAGDVKQHMAMRKALIKRNLLKPPRMWKPLG